MNNAMEIYAQFFEFEEKLKEFHTKFLLIRSNKPFSDEKEYNRALFSWKNEVSQNVKFLQKSGKMRVQIWNKKALFFKT